MRPHTITTNVGELYETRRVNEANQRLALGWKLLAIADHWRGHVYILGVQTALNPTSTPAPSLPDPSLVVTAPA